MTMSRTSMIVLIIGFGGAALVATMLSRESVAAIGVVLALTVVAAVLGRLNAVLWRWVGGLAHDDLAALRKTAFYGVTAIGTGA